jgi:hypothetical protein
MFDFFWLKQKKIFMSFEVEIKAFTTERTNRDFETKGITVQQILPLLFKI